MQIIEQQPCENSVVYVKQPSQPDHIITMTRVGTDNPTDTFIYNIANIGPSQPHLEYIVLGICDEITEEQIESITVNGELVEDYEIITDSEDCNGLRIPVELLSGQPNDPPPTATLVITFTVPFAVGPINVCFGVQTGGSEVDEVPLEGNICGPVCDTVSCDTTVFQTIDVCVPVTVTASADVGPVTVVCCGNVNVSLNPCPIEGDTEITFYVRRRVCAIIPIDIDVEAEDGQATVELVATSEEACQDCPGSNGD